jgi:hypothetical protein
VNSTRLTGMDGEPRISQHEDPNEALRILLHHIVTALTLARPADITARIRSEAGGRPAIAVIRASIRPGTGFDDAEPD